MFKLVPDPVFQAVVQLTVPGSPKPAPVTFNFRHKGRRELNAWLHAATGKPHAEVMAEVIDAWAGVQRPDGSPVPYTPEALAQVLDAYPASGDEIFQAYLDALLQGRQKN